MAYEIQINGFIGEAGFFGGDSFTLKNLTDALAQMPSDATEINIMINSGGGYVTEGFAIHDKLATLDKVVNTKVLGLAGSIATVIAQAPKSQGKGGLRSGYQNSDYFIHNPSWSPQSPDPIEADELHKIAEDLKSNEEKLINFYATTTGGDSETFKAKMKEAKSLSMLDAKELGLIDEIISTQIKAATLYKFAAHISKNVSPMNKIEAFLSEQFTKFKAEIQAIVKPEVKNATVKTSEGIDIFYDGELAVGTKVFTNVEMTTPAPDGVHTVGDKLYTIANGEVTKVEDVQTNTKTDLEIANEKIAELTAQLESANGTIAAKTEEVATAVAAKETELTNKFETKFTDFKSKFFTGEKLNEQFVQIMKNEGQVEKPKGWREGVVELRKKQEAAKAK